MSRLCVKNVPKYVAEDRLREFFSQKGEVTDAKLMRTKDGKSRQFAFVGFRTEQEAEEALKYYHNSYLDTCRITCEVARKVGDPNIPRPWSRLSKNKDTPSKDNINAGPGSGAQISPAFNSKGPGSAKNSKSSEDGDPQLQEFLQIMQQRAKSKLWANDTLEAEGKAVLKEAQTAGIKKKQSSADSAQAVQVRAAVGNDGEDELVPETTSAKQLDETARDDVVSDTDYFRSRVKKNWSDSETDDEDSADEGADGDGRRFMVVEAKDHTVKAEDDHIHDGQEQVEMKDSDVQNIDNEDLPLSSDESKQALDTGRLFVRNLPYTTNEDELVELFSQFGDVSQVHLVVDKDTKRSKGIAYVLYALPESTVRALEELDNSIFQGRLLHVMPAKPQNPSTEKLGSNLSAVQDKKNFKQRREEQKKASEASGDTRAWNSLFMRPDTVVENIARKHGISKSDLLDREADDLAVRIALGETHVIAETKRVLLSAGVNVAALEEYASRKTENIKRSNHVILVKNLSYGSSEGDLANMFGKFGSLDKIILPPTKALALVIFLEAAEARAAFKGLAYKRYKDAPLYLEWAPGNILSPDTTSDRGEQKNVEQNIKSIILEQCVEGMLEEEIDSDRVESRSVFVKNLNFKTSDESLRKHFSDNMKKGCIKSVKVKKHLKNGKNVSMGFGFIEFDSVETATDICRDLQGTISDGHALILQLCHAKKDGRVLKKDEKDKCSTKLIVRNVAFEATEKDLRQLFSPFGQIKSLRLPMKFGGHRGFAFVEFVTKQEAQNALQALSSTHLYGRHLVIERAKEGESLEELRARTAAQFVDEQSGFQKLSQKRKHTTAADEGNVKFSRIIG